MHFRERPEEEIPAVTTLSLLVPGKDKSQQRKAQFSNLKTLINFKITCYNTSFQIIISQSVNLPNFFYS